MMKFRFTLAIIFVFFAKVHGFENTFTEGKEYKFKYNLNSMFYVRHGTSSKPGDFYFFGGDLTIKALPDNWLECHLENVFRKGVDYLDELREKFEVKINEGKIVEFKTSGSFTDKGNLKKKQMIEEIIRNRSDIVNFIQEGRHEIEMPIGAKCDAELTMEIKNNNKIYKARTSLSKCVDKENVSSEFGEPLPDSSSEVELIYDTDTNKQTGVDLFNAIRLDNSKQGGVFQDTNSIRIIYLGSKDL